MSGARIARRAFRRMEIMDDIYGTSVSFVLGALVVFIGLYPALIRQEGELQAARQKNTSLSAYQRFLDAREAKERGYVFGETP